MQNELRRVMPALTLVLGACATIEPPGEPDHPVTVYLADYGRHASLILPADEGWTEYAYGEWKWFALEDNWLVRAPRVLLLPSDAALGRRRLPTSGDQGISGIVEAAGAVRAIPIAVAPDAAGELAAVLETRFDAGAESRVHNRNYDMDFVRDPSRYWLPHNCNSQIAAWLRDLGCRVNGPAVFSGFRLAAPREPAARPARPPAAAPCRSDPPPPSRSAG